MLKYAEINILDITVQHLDITIEHRRWLSHTLKEQYSWQNYILILRTRKYCYQTNATVWSSDLYKYSWDSYTGIPKRHIARRKIYIQNQYLDIQLCDKQLTYSVLISKIFILTYFNILDGKAECSDITTEYIRCLSHSWISIFLHLPREGYKFVDMTIRFIAIVTKILGLL